MTLTLPLFQPSQFSWHQLQAIQNRAFDCGYCGRAVSSDRGFAVERNVRPPVFTTAAWVCPNCQGLTFFCIYDSGIQLPAPAIGRPVPKTPASLSGLYEEARRCTTQQCYTAAVLICRKMLMNIAVQEGATEGLKFIEYVDHLALKGFIPPNGREWVDHIRKKGNEATHEIVLMGAQDAIDLITFTEMLLRFIYEFPAMVPPKGGA